MAKLSGGEKRRLYLLTLLVHNPNFLILDEPTNDLDIVTLNLLEEFLVGYQGCLLLVTHDRYFMDRLVDHVFVFTDSGIVRDINGNYTEYRNMLEDEKIKLQLQEQKSKEKEKVKPVANNKDNIKRKLSFKEQKEFETIEKELEALENKKKQLIEKMGDTNLSHEAIHSASIEFENTNNLIESKTMRWLELSELA